MKLRPIFAAMIMALLGALLLAPSAAMAAKNSKPLRNMKVTGTLVDGRAFSGNVTITKFSYDATEGLMVDGLLTGTVTNADETETAIRQAFTNVPATLAGGVSAQNAAAAQQCQILFLDIGPIFLDLLGLQVDLSQIVLDITAVGGAGNLLGNLLCAVAGLLDPGSGLLRLIENLGRLLDLLNQINSLL